jgi:hypothetical protein
MAMHRLSRFPLIFLLTIILQLSVLSQTTRLQSGWFQSTESQHKRINRRVTSSVQFDCLPKDFQLTDIVSYRKRQKSEDKQITIEDKLVELKAHCKAGKLIDSKGQEVRFFKLSCFGNPPENIDEIVQKERQTLATLQKKYRVIVIECDPHIN